MSLAIGSFIAGIAPAASASDKNGQDNTPAQCAEAHLAVAAGQPLPNLRLFRKGHGALHNNTLTIFNDGSQYGNEIAASAEAWTRASGGKVRVTVSDHPSEHSVRVYDVNRDTHWVGWTRREPWRILLNSAFLDSMSPNERQATITHEFGHAMGLKHGCPGDVMHAISDQGQPVEPTATDVQALLQEESGNSTVKTGADEQSYDAPDFVS